MRRESVFLPEARALCHTKSIAACVQYLTIPRHRFQTPAQADERGLDRRHHPEAEDEHDPEVDEPDRPGDLGDGERRQPGEDLVVGGGGVLGHVSSRRNPGGGR